MNQNPSQRHELSAEEIAVSLAVAESIANLEKSEGWQNLVKAAEFLIQQKTPDISQFSAEEATLIASKMAHVSGIKACLAIVKNSHKKIVDLKKAQSKLK